jgi:hypothetical protein
MLTPINHHPITNPIEAEQALKGIVIATAAEDYYRKAKDSENLFKAIEIKIRLQAEYVVWRDNVVEPSQKTGSSGVKGRSRVTELLPDFPDSDPGKMTASRWRKRFCDGRGKIDLDKLRLALEEAQRMCLRICEQEKLGTVRGTEGTGEFERYTPAEYVDAVRRVLGEIDLDPATSLKAQETVRAIEYFTVADNGLARNWHDRIFLNPPYHRELCPEFINKLLMELGVGRVTEAIILTNNCADTDWFDNAARLCNSICFTHGRIHFLDKDDQEVLPTQGQTFFYYGRSPDRFERIFDRDLGGSIGRCFRPLSRNYRDSDQ